MKLKEDFKDALATVVNVYRKNYVEGVTNRLWSVDRKMLAAHGFSIDNAIPITTFVDTDMIKTLSLMWMQYIPSQSDPNTIALFYFEPYTKEYNNCFVKYAVQYENGKIETTEIDRKIRRFNLKD